MNQEREAAHLHPLLVIALCIVVFLRTSMGRVTIGVSIQLTGASRNTLKQHFRMLVGRGYLNQHGGGRGVSYDLR